jgi:SAM-dependent methyltransferase
MQFTGERYVPELKGQIAYEHLHRYEIARRFAEGRDVLDVACGEGYGSSYLAQVASSVVGVDSDAETVRHAASRYTAMNLRFRAGDATQLPLADDSFDLVVSFETIEHLVEHEKMLDEIRRVLRDDGQLIISSPNKLVYSDLPGYRNPYHLRELYFDEFRDLLLRYFPSCAIFGHRIFAASAVHPLGGIAEQPDWLGMTDLSGDAGLPALPAPTYFLAVCGRGGDELRGLASVYIDPHHDLLTRLWDTLPILTATPQGELAAADAETFAVEASPLSLASGAEPALSANVLEQQLLAERAERERLMRDLEAARAAFVANDERTAAEAVARAERETLHAEEVERLAQRLLAEQAMREAVERELGAEQATRQAIERDLDAARGRVDEVVAERIALEEGLLADRAASEALAAAERASREQAQRDLAEAAGAAQAARQAFEHELDAARAQLERVAAERAAADAELAGARDQLELAATASRELLERERAAARNAQRSAAEAELERHQFRTILAERDDALARAYQAVGTARQQVAEEARRRELELAESRTLAGLLAARLAAATRLAAVQPDPQVELQLEMLKTSLASSAIHVEELRSERDRLVGRLHDAESALQAMVSSRSWRMTAPLRSSVAALRGDRSQ